MPYPGIGFLSMKGILSSSIQDSDVNYLNEVP